MKDHFSLNMAKVLGVLPMDMLSLDVEDIALARGLRRATVLEELVKLRRLGLVVKARPAYKSWWRLSALGRRVLVELDESNSTLRG